MKVRTEARREAILEVASQVFLEFGFERASIGEMVRRIGGSKSTIYGYYPSKEALFQSVVEKVGEIHIQAAFDELASHDGGEGIRDVLDKFSEKLAAFLCSHEILSTHRMVLAEAGRSNMGELFYEAGPKRGIIQLAGLLQRAMEKGLMRKESPMVAALQFFALIQAEMQLRWYYTELPPLTGEQIKDLAGRAMATFSRAYLQGGGGSEHADSPSFAHVPDGAPSEQGEAGR